MSSFTLNERLANGSADLGTHGICRVLLKNNAHFLWVLLVPEVDAEVTEMHHLDEEQYASVCHSMRVFSQWMKQQPGVEKVNVAAIGNQVRQLHIHIVGRHSQDIAWPGVVWACSEKQAYTPERYDEMQKSLGEIWRRDLQSLSQPQS
jgi:diadenosine tetraphosphate (Ap4A) HIT family hydrolase